MSDSDPVIVHPLPAEALPAWASAMASTFLQNPAGEEADRRVELLTRLWDPDRSWGARAGGNWVATFRTEARKLTVPGPAAEVPVDAVTAVTVAATHRRRGLLRELMTRSLAAAARSGDVASVLIAAEWPIYGRFGYAPATQSADYVLDRRRPGSVVAGDPSRLRQVERDEARELGPVVFERARRRDAGQMDRPSPWWSRTLGGDGFSVPSDQPHNWLVHEGDDGPDGLLAWSAKGEPTLVPPRHSLEVAHLLSGTDTAYRDTWAYLTGVDLIDEVRLTNRPLHEPLRWLVTDARTLALTRRVDFLWLRLLDVPAALSARRYACDGEVVLEVIDEAGAGYAAGRYRLLAEGGEAGCERTTAMPEVRIDQRALAAIYLGGFRLAELPAGSAVELREGKLALVDLMFSTPLAPWNATWF